MVCDRPARPEGRVAASEASLSLQHGARRRPFVVRSGRILLAYGILAVLLLVYQQKSPRFTERQWQSLANQGMTLATASFGQTVVILTGIAPTIGVQSYSFREFGLEQALKQYQTLGLKYAEFFSKHIPLESTVRELGASRLALRHPRPARRRPVRRAFPGRQSDG